MIGTVASANETDNLRVIDPTTEEVTASWTFSNGRVLSTSLSDGGSKLLVGVMLFNSDSPKPHTGLVVFFDLELGIQERTWFIEETRGVVAVALAADRKSFLAGAYDGSVQEISIPDSSIQWTYKHCCPIAEVLFHPTDPNLVFSSSWDGKVVILDRTRKQSMGEIRFRSAIHAMDIANNGHYLAVGTVDGIIEIHDISKLKSQDAHDTNTR